MRARLLLAATAVVSLAAAGFAPVPPPRARKARFALADLEGAWEVVRHEVGHATRGAGASTMTYQTVFIKRGTWMARRVFRNGSDVRTVTYTISLDATKAPAVFDLTFTPEEGASYTLNGVAELKGDRLTVVHTLGKDRPTSIEGFLGARQERWSLKRKKP